MTTASLRAQVRALEREVERLIAKRGAERKRTTVVGPAVIRLDPGVEVMIERRAILRAQSRLRRKVRRSFK